MYINEFDIVFRGRIVAAINSLLPLQLRYDAYFFFLYYLSSFA